MFTLCCLALLPTQPKPEEIRTFELCKNDQYTLHVKARQSISMDQTEILWLELENHTGQPLRLRPRLELLVKANKQLFPHDYSLYTGHLGEIAEGIRSADHFTAPAGKTTVGRDTLSRHAAAALGIPKQDQVDVTMVVTSFIDGKTHQVTIPMKWLRPSAAAIEVLKKELHTLLFEKPPERDEIAQRRLTSLLNSDEVTKDLSLDRLLTALTGRNYQQRVFIVNYLLQRHTNDPKVIDFYVQQLAKNDEKVLYDLIISIFMPKPGQLRHEQLYFWDERLIEPLIAMFERDPAKFERAVEILLLHPDNWHTDPKRTARLAAALKKKYPILVRGPWNNLQEQELYDLCRACLWLGKTFDRASLPLLKTVLDVTKPEAPRYLGEGAVHPNAILGGTAASHAAAAIINILEGPEKKNQPLNRSNPASTDTILRARQLLKDDEAKAANSKK